MTSYLSKFLQNRKAPKSPSPHSSPQDSASHQRRQEKQRAVPKRESSDEHIDKDRSIENSLDKSIDKSLETIEVGLQYVSKQCADAGLLWDIPSSKKSSSARAKQPTKRVKNKKPSFRLISSNRDSNTSLRTGTVGRKTKDTGSNTGSSPKGIKYGGSNNKPKMSSDRKSKSMPSSGFLQERLESRDSALTTGTNNSPQEKKELPRRSSEAAAIRKSGDYSPKRQGATKSKSAHVHTESRTDQSRVSKLRLQKIEEYKRQLDSGVKPSRRKSTMNISSRDSLWKENNASQPTPLEKSMGYAGVAPLLGGAFVKSFRKKSRSKSFTNTSRLPYDKNRSKAFAREVELDANSTDNENFVSDRESYFSYVSKKKTKPKLADQVFSSAEDK